MDDLPPGPAFFKDTLDISGETVVNVLLILLVNTIIRIKNIKVYYINYPDEQTLYTLCIHAWPPVPLFYLVTFEIHTLHSHLLKNHSIKPTPVCKGYH